MSHAEVPEVFQSPSLRTILLTSAKWSDVAHKPGLDIHEAPSLNRPSFRFTLSGLAGCVLVAATALTPISEGVHFNTFARSYYRAVAGILAVAALRSRALSPRQPSA
jgi:hypothetical protein